MWAVALGVYKLAPVPMWVVQACGVVSLALPFCGYLVGWRRKEGPEMTARWLDRSIGLQERLSTTLEFARESVEDAWTPALVSQAAACLPRIDLRRTLPWRLPKVTYWAAMLLAIGAGLGWVPEIRSQAYLTASRDKEVIRDTGKQLAAVTKRILEKKNPAVEGAKTGLKATQELGEQLAKAPPTKREALQELAKATEALKQQAKQMAQDPALKQMQKAANSQSPSSQAKAEELQKQIDAMKKSFEGKEARPEAVEKIKEELKKLEQKAASLAQQQNQGGPEGKEGLSQSLASLQKQAQDMGMAMPNLDEAIAALQEGKIDQVLKQLAAAEKDLEKMQQMARQLQKMQQQAQKAGKDLGEQLANGEAQRALQTLQKMINQLKAGNLSQDEMKKLAEEVEKAIKPSAEYGKMNEHLKEALNAMKGGDKHKAAQSLADAAKELEKLMEEMGDMQGMQAAMDALKRAQMAIGTGEGWCKTPGNGPPKAGKGGKPSSGVGTWADEEGGEAPEQNNDWDNSDVNRPDQDPRGLTDRGEGELAPGMTPTRLRGKMNPGGPTPSISLKGVSIRGQSAISLKEAAATAQSDAQSALSQDQVPRAYQGAVKDYFDDIKK